MSDLDNKSKQLTEKELINLGGIIALNKKKEEDKQNKMIELSSLLEEMFQEIPDILKLDNKNQICNKYNTWIQLYLPRSKEYIKILNKDANKNRKRRTTLRPRTAASAVHVLHINALPGLPSLRNDVRAVRTVAPRRTQTCS